MRKYITLIFMLVIPFILVACDNKGNHGNGTEPDVVSIEFTMSNYELAPGVHTLAAKALPEGSNQDIRFSLQGIVEGVTVSDKTLTISPSVEDQMTFTVVASSVYDPTIRANQVFTVINQGSTDVIEIRTEEELRAISLNGNYKLVNDIELENPWIPIGISEKEEESGEVIPGQYFNGVFDGQGFKISGIDIKSQQGEPLFNGGFFAQIGVLGIVKNTEFEGKLVANGWSGGVAGINEGLITNVISNMEVTVFGTSAGSIVSVNRGTISYSYGIGKVVSESNPNAEGRSAGLVVANEGTMEEVYGDKDTMTTPNYIAFTPMTNPNYMLSTAEMKLKSTFEQFDEDVWYIEDGTYPLLKHEGFLPPTI